MRVSQNGSGQRGENGLLAGRRYKVSYGQTPDVKMGQKPARAATQKSKAEENPNLFVTTGAELWWQELSSRTADHTRGGISSRAIRNPPDTRGDISLCRERESGVIMAVMSARWPHPGDGGQWIPGSSTPAYIKYHYLPTGAPPGTHEMSGILSYSIDLLSDIWQLMREVSFLRNVELS